MKIACVALLAVTLTACDTGSNDSGVDTTNYFQAASAPPTLPRTTNLVARSADTSSEALEESTPSPVTPKKEILFNSAGGTYNLVVLVNGDSLESISAIAMTPEGGASEDISSSAETGSLTDDAEQRILSLFPASIPDDSLVTQKAGTLYAEIKAPQIPSGTTHFEVTLQLTNHTETKLEFTQRLDQAATHK